MEGLLVALGAGCFSVAVAVAECSHCRALAGRGGSQGNVSLSSPATLPLLLCFLVAEPNWNWRAREPCWYCPEKSASRDHWARWWRSENRSRGAKNISHPAPKELWDFYEQSSFLNAFVSSAFSKEHIMDVSWINECMNKSMGRTKMLTLKFLKNCVMSTYPSFALETRKLPTGNESSHGLQAISALWVHCIPGLIHPSSHISSCSSPLGSFLAGSYRVFQCRSAFSGYSAVSKAFQKVKGPPLKPACLPPLILDVLDLFLDSCWIALKLAFPHSGWYSLFLYCRSSTINYSSFVSQWMKTVC